MDDNCLAINECLQLGGFLVAIVGAIGGGINVLGTGTLQNFTPKRSFVVGALGLIFAMIGSLGVVPDIGVCVPIPWHRAKVKSDPAIVVDTSGPAAGASTQSPPVAIQPIKPATVAAPTPVPAPAPVPDPATWPRNAWVDALEIKPGDEIPDPRPLPMHWKDDTSGLLLSYTVPIAGSQWNLEETAIGNKITTARFWRIAAQGTRYRDGDHLSGDSQSQVDAACGESDVRAFTERLAAEFGKQIDSSRTMMPQQLLRLGDSGSCADSWMQCDGRRFVTLDRTIFKVAIGWQLEFQAKYQEDAISKINNNRKWVDSGTDTYTCWWILKFAAD